MRYYSNKYNRKFSKIIAVFLSITILGTALSNTVSVSAAGNLAYSCGCLYGTDGNNLDMTVIVRKACDYYALCGYTSRYNMNPDVNDPVATYNGTRKIEADIVMFTGHGNYQGITFNSKDQGGKFNFVVSHLSLAVDHQIKITDYDMSKVKLMIFAGCGTASNGNNNVCQAVVNDGCTTSVGSGETVYYDDLVKWMDKFNNYLTTGNTVKRAVEIANTFSYGHNSIKSAKVYGNGNLIIKKSTAKSAAVEDIGSVMVNQTFASEQLNDKNAIRTLLQSVYPTFSFEDFKIDLAMQENGSAVITVVEKVGDYYSDNAYVLFYDGDKITEIFDRVEHEINRSSYNTEQFALPLIDMEKVYAAARENIGVEYTIENQEVEAKIDSATGERYLLVGTTVSIDGANSVLSYKYVIG